MCGNGIRRGAACEQQAGVRGANPHRAIKPKNVVHTTISFGFGTVFAIFHRAEARGKEGRTIMTQTELKLKVIDNAETIARSLKNGKDVEIRKTASGISVTEIKKTVVSR